MTHEQTSTSAVPTRQLVDISSSRTQYVQQQSSAAHWCCPLGVQMPSVVHCEAGEGTSKSFSQLATQHEVQPVQQQLVQLLCCCSQAWYCPHMAVYTVILMLGLLQHECSHGQHNAVVWLLIQQQLAYGFSMERVIATSCHGLYPAQSRCSRRA